MRGGLFPLFSATERNACDQRLPKRGLFFLFTRDLLIIDRLQNMVARHFGESQAIKMPAFDRRIPTEDLNLLVDYVLLLRSFGDMSLSEAQRYRTLYALDDESPDTRFSE